MSPSYPGPNPQPPTLGASTMTQVSDYVFVAAWSDLTDLPRTKLNNRDFTDSVNHLRGLDAKRGQSTMAGKVTNFLGWSRSEQVLSAQQAQAAAKIQALGLVKETPLTPLWKGGQLKRLSALYPIPADVPPASREGAPASSMQASTTPTLHAPTPKPGRVSFPKDLSRWYLAPPALTPRSESPPAQASGRSTPAGNPSSGAGVSPSPSWSREAAGTTTRGRADRASSPSSSRGPSPRPSRSPSPSLDLLRPSPPSTPPPVQVSPSR